MPGSPPNDSDRRRQVATPPARRRRVQPGVRANDVRVVVTFFFVLFENVLQLHHEVRNDVAAQIF